MNNTDDHAVYHEHYLEPIVCEEPSHKKATSPASASGIHRFCELARIYVDVVGIDDRFRIVGRVRGNDTREIAWCPGQGPTTLTSAVADYQEYFEHVLFPDVDPEVVGGDALVPTRITASGVDLCHLTLHGDERVVSLLEACLQTLEAEAKAEAPASHATVPPTPPPSDALTPAGGLPSGMSESRRKRLELYKATWVSRASTEELLEQRLADDDDAVVEAAANLCVRYSLTRMVETLQAMLQDPRPGRRAVAVRTLRGLDPAAAIPATLAQLRDPDTGVRSEALSTLRHAGHLPWARRRHMLNELAGEIAPCMQALEPQQQADIVALFSACDRAEALQLVLEASAHPDPTLRDAALRTLTTQSGPGVAERLVEALETIDDEALGMTLVEGLQRTELLAALRQEPALLERAMACLARLSEVPG